MKHPFVLFCLLIIIASASGCKDKNKEEVEKRKKIEEAVKASENVNAGTGTYTIEAPEGWTKADTTLMGYRTTMLKSEREGLADDFMENINVVTEKTGSISFEEYIKATDRNIPRMLTNYTEKERKDITVDGVPAKSIDYSHTVQGYPVDVNAVLLVKNGMAYVITSSVEKGKMSKWRDDIDFAVSSFHTK